jgi:PAS domain S-box-containing protein
MSPSEHSEQFFRLMVENVSDYAVFMLDENNRHVSWNPGVGRILQYSEAEWLGQSGRIIFTEEDIADGQPEREMDTARAEGRAEDKRWHVRKDGTRFWANGVLMTLRDAGGQIAGFAKFLRDETQHKLWEQQVETLNISLEDRVRERTHELASAQRSLQELTSALMRAAQQERRRLARLLHDHLQQLLVGVQMHCRLLDSGLTRDGDRKVLATVLEAISESIAVTRSLAAELFPPVLHELGLAAALTWLGTRMSEQYRLNVVVRADRAANPQDEQVRDFLFQCARELLLNVVKHARTERAALTLSVEANHTVLTVRDEGAGLAPHQGEQLHGSFGLFQLRQQLSVLGGELHLEGSEGRGTVAVVKVPRAPAAVGDDRPPIRVLIADDHQMIREGLLLVLERQPDMLVVGVARNGEETLQLARTLKPDVAVVDVSMPGISGIEAVRVLAAEVPSIRSVALSFREDEQTIDEMLQAGAVGYVAKGGPTDELVAEIRRAAGR